MSAVPAVLLSADPGPDEARVWWDETDEGDCLHVWGTRDVRRAVLSLLDEPRLELVDDFRRAMAARSDGTVRSGPSVVARLEALGFDPRTLVLSVRKAGAASAPAPAAGDVPGLLAAVAAELHGLSRLAEGFDAAKDVYVLDEGDRDAVLEGVARAEELLARATAAIVSAAGGNDA